LRLKGERERSFVFTEALRKKYQDLAPEPLNSFIQFSCEIGICEGEIIDLVKADRPADHCSCQGHPHGVDGEIKV